MVLTPAHLDSTLTEQRRQEIQSGPHDNLEVVGVVSLRRNASPVPLVVERIGKADRKAGDVLRAGLVPQTKDGRGMDASA